MKVMWEKQPLDKLVIDYVAPGSGKLTLREVRQKFEKLRLKIPSNRRYVLSQQIARLEKFSVDRMDNFTVKDLLNVCDKAKMRWEKQNLKVAFLASLRWYFGVKNYPEIPSAPEPTPNGDVQMKIKFKAATVDMLEEILIPKGMHTELIIQAMDSIADCPQNEIRIMDGTEMLDGNKKLRVSIQMAINKSINQKGWGCFWSCSRKFLLLARKESIKSFKALKGAKAK